MKFTLFLLLPILVLKVKSQSSKIINPEGCGKRLNDVIPNKIVGGQTSKVGDWGWQVGINYMNRFTCGGAILNEYWIVTAAHCVFGRATPPFYKLLFGYTDRLTPNAWSETRSVDAIIRHENFTSVRFSNDIALMKLSIPLKFSNYILPACIPTSNSDYTGKNSWTTGWGATSYEGPLSNHLLEVELPILSDMDCFLKYLANKVTSFCAGETGANLDACQGDSGGPLVILGDNGENRGNWTLVGLTSYGKGCGDGGVFTRVSNYYDWILQKINEN